MKWQLVYILLYASLPSFPPFPSPSTSPLLLGINVPRSRFLPVKKTSDLLVVMSNLFTLEHGTLRINRKRSYPSLPLVKLGDEHFTKVCVYVTVSWGENISWPDILEVQLCWGKGWSF